MGYSTVRRIMREGLTDPRNLDGIALWNSTRDVTDLTTDTGIKLWADKSGNSSTNVLCLNGVAGNYASAPDAAFATTQLEVVGYVAAANWTLGTAQIIAAKHASVAQRSFYFGVSATTGTLFGGISSDGSAITNATSSVALTATNFVPLWVKMTWVSATGIVQYFTSPDNVTWTQLGANVNGIQLGNSIFDSTSPIEVGAYLGGTSLMMAGNIHRVIIRNTVGGADAWDFNFSGASKLAPSFTCATGQTVTINTSGATGARISGARDLYQGTAANQPILTIAAAGNYLTFDGSNDYLKAAAFSLSQPETVYFVGSQVTWTISDYVYDGGATNSGNLTQSVATPQLFIYAGGGGGMGDGNLAVATNGVITSVYSGAASSKRTNRGAATTGTNIGTTAMNGFTLGANGAGAAGYGNITAQEVLVYSTAQDENYQYRVTRLISRRTGVLVV